MCNGKAEGLLVVVSGPSASGKGTVNRRVLEDESFVFSVSATTREMRPEDVDGKTYHFVSKKDFEELIKKDGVIEYTTYCGNYYGTLRKQTEEVLAEGKNLLLEIEVEGAENIRRKYPEAVLIMLLPPCYAEQERRLRTRGTETEEKIEKRLLQTKEEMQHLASYDYIVYNRTGHAADAAEDILAIVRAERCRRTRHPNALSDYFE